MAKKVWVKFSNGMAISCASLEEAQGIARQLLSDSQPAVTFSYRGRQHRIERKQSDVQSKV